LFLTALNNVSGGFDKAIVNASDVLAIKGKVLPVSLDNVILKAELEDGTKVSGETKISKSKKAISTVEIFPENAKSSRPVTEAILKADYIILGPGSLYTSIIVNLLFKDVLVALKKTRAKKIYVCNIMTQVGETTNFKLSDHINAIEKHSYKGVVDIVLVNNGKIQPSVARRYKKEKSIPVVIDKKTLKNVKIIEKDFVSKTQYAHHDYNKLAKIIFSLLRRNQK
jgi:uncharacterized cofD-like protein